MLDESYTENNNLYNYPEAISSRSEDQVDRHILNALFYLLKILPYNVSSNKGFLDTLRYLWEKSAPAVNNTYQIIRADINIHWRFVCLMCSKWHFFEHERRYSALLLFQWHCYSMAIRAVWGEFCNTLIAPAFHLLFPGSSIKGQVRLATMVGFLTDFACAERKCRDQLAVLYNQHPDNSGLIYMRQFFEYFLPVVSLPIYIYIYI